MEKDECNLNYARNIINRHYSVTVKLVHIKQFVADVVFPSEAI